MSNGVNLETNGVTYDDAQGEDGLKRRNSLERYRPGAYFNEEREKLRRRCGFGERRLDQNKENKANGHKRGNRGRGNGGGHRGGNRNDFHSYRNGTKRNEDDYDDDSQEVEAPPPPPIGNWADDPISPEASPIKSEPTWPSVQPNKETKSEPEVRDLRDKLNSMKVSNSNGGAAGENHQRHNKPRHNGQGDRHNGHGDQKFARNKPGRDRGQQQQQYQHQRACQSSLPLPKRNTVNFDPSHEPSQMRIIAAEPGLRKYNRRYQTRDVVMASDIFCKPDDLTIYDKLLDEIEHSGVDAQRLWQLWHGDSHVIADDHLGQWKEKCPTFSWVVEKMASYFDMDVKATRLNWYRDSSEWKPFHHDAAAMKEKFARTQNFTLGVSFGAEREAAFEHAQTKTIISMPQPNGAVYTFGRDVNIIWRHGIPQLPPEKQSEEGRISIIAWGWIDMDEV